MQDHSSLLDLSRLRRTEAECQAHLLRDPMDGNARIQIAWCLFLQAVQASAQDIVERSLVRRLLHDSLIHAATLTQIGNPSVSCDEILRLRSLIESLGGTDIIREADHEAARILTTLYSDLTQRR
jgi:hypothetical protein